MMATCEAPIPEETLIDYWTHDLADGAESDRVEEHLFACGDCSARLQQLAALGTGLAALVRDGRVAGIVSRSILNRLQRDGVHVRMFWLGPARRYRAPSFPATTSWSPLCAPTSPVWTPSRFRSPGPAARRLGQCDDVPVAGLGGEVLWATPAALVQQMPSMRLQLTLTSAGATHDELGRYVLEHSA